MADAFTEIFQQPLSLLPGELRQRAEDQIARLAEHASVGDIVGWSPSDLRNFIVLLACSDYAAGASLRHWPWFSQAVAEAAFELVPASVLELPTGDVAQNQRALRRYRHRQMLHILWREYAAKGTTSETLQSLSTLADEVLLAARALAMAELEPRFGVPVTTNGEAIFLTILAMGKLGGCELNFSSDVDVIFLYSEAGESNGVRSLSAHEYFTRVTRRVVRYLDDVTADGFVFRVDTRLRPFGDSGPSVVSFNALESYLLQHGRSWERYAYVKARVIGNTEADSVAREQLELMIQPFVYRRYLDYGVFESLREMKALIEAEVRKRELADNIKLGPGGIREVEFIVQSLQLVRGGRNPQLRQRGLAAAMSALTSSRMISRAVAEQLMAAYWFLRRAENFIQAIQDRQTHDLPADELGRARLAAALQLAGWPEVERLLQEHRGSVVASFREVVFRDDSGDVEDAATDARVAAWRANEGVDHWTRLLSESGTVNAGPLAVEITGFARRVRAQKIDSESEKRLTQLLPSLLNSLHSRAGAARTFRRVAAVIERIVRRSAYIALLNENQPVLQRLVDLCEQSSFLADEIGRFPVLLDEMLDPRLFTDAISASGIRADIAERLRRLDGGDSELVIEALAQSQRAIMFRIAVVDFSDRLPIMKVSDALTDLAEVVLRRALEVAWRDLVGKHGEPWFSENGRRQRAGFSVIAYGKLGGMELSYGSDLDLVFLHDSHGDEQFTDGELPLDNGMFFGRLVRRLVHFLTIQTPSGALYEIDTRLRPSGRSGLLVINVDAFERYQKENAWTWEHQALLRSRPIAGSVAVNREFQRIRMDTLRGRVARDSLADDVRKMRERMQRELDRGSADQFDLKLGAGGIGELEFLVQYLVLKNADSNIAVIHYPDNIRQLGTLGAAGILDTTEVSQLQDIYRAYRRRMHRLALDARPPLVPVDEFVDERQFVHSRWLRELG